MDACSSNTISCVSWKSDLKILKTAFPFVLRLKIKTSNGRLNYVSQMFGGMVANKRYNAQLSLSVDKSCRRIELELEVVEVPSTF